MISAIFDTRQTWIKCDYPFPCTKDLIVNFHGYLSDFFFQYVMFFSSLFIASMYELLLSWVMWVNWTILFRSTCIREQFSFHQSQISMLTNDWLIFLLQDSQVLDLCFAVVSAFIVYPEILTMSPFFFLLTKFWEFRERKNLSLI